MLVLVFYLYLNLNLRRFVELSYWTLDTCGLTAVDLLPSYLGRWTRGSKGSWTLDAWTLDGCEGPLFSSARNMDSRTKEYQHPVTRTCVDQSQKHGHDFFSALTAVRSIS